MSQELERHVYAVQRYTALTAPCYAALLGGRAISEPICCFGDPLQARVVTVGLNPSKTEQGFIADGQAITHTEVARRCCQYFIGGNPHQYFRPWMQALSHLDASYADGSAVHLDLSPRITRFVSELKEHWEQELFLKMVERDLWTFFGTLKLSRNAGLMLIAGSVTGRYYINEFLQRFAPDYGCSLDGSFSRLKDRGPGKTAFHVLSGNGRKLPAFFCSTSPAGRDKTLLPKAVKAHAEHLQRMLAQTAEIPSTGHSDG